MYKKIILLLMCLVGTFFIIYKCVDTKKSKKGNAADVGNTDNDYASQKTESKTTETEEKNDMEPKITEIYWSYGKEYVQLFGKSRFHVDINLHVKTENYNDGDTVNITLRRNDEEPLFDAIKKLNLNGIIVKNEITFENVLKKYILNM